MVSQAGYTSRVQTCPTVSVILPVWNGERFLAEAVESVLAQTFEAIELLIVDDGSTDATPEIADAFAQRDRRVQVIRLEHCGIADALNAGIAEAQGRYVARMDADDISHPSRLAIQIAYLDANSDCVAVGSAVEVIDESGDFVGTRTFPRGHAEITHKMIHGLANALAHPTVVTRTDALRSVGGYRHDRVPSEDLDLWIRLSRIGTLANMSDRLLRYRRHRDTVSVRERDGQWKIGNEIINEARRRQGLRPLAVRPLSAARSRVASYHFECARTALLTGPRAAAFKHARASIASEPFWPEPYMALAACLFPKWSLRLLRGVATAVQSLQL
ncbi:MAG: glycosyltransferase [Acidobacteriota bacterium]|nr:glycosyltransferase [Acidobacteriota bacterium]